MSRYFNQFRRVTKMVRSPRAKWDDYSPMLPPITVNDHKPIDTGLIDHRGDPIMRGPNPVGFHNAKDRGA